jgi:hypothetical protein
VWDFVSDLEASAPAYDTDVHSLRIVAQEGEQLRIRARLPWWGGTVPVRFRVTMHEGWCWMVSEPQLYVVGMAAEPSGTSTRFAYLEGLALPAPRVMRPINPLLLAVSRWRHRHHVPRDVDRIAEHVERH